MAREAALDTHTLTLTTEDIYHNDMGAIYDLAKFLGLRLHRFHHGKTAHVKCIGILARGQFHLWDYGQGLLRVEISFNPMYNNLSFHVGNADDGGWRAVSRHISQEKAEAMIVKLYEKLSEWKELPSDAEVISILTPFGFAFEEHY